jgi:endonuclease YncB( thermonuclease family)
MSTAIDAAITQVFLVTDGDTIRIFRRWREIDIGNRCAPGLLMDEVREFYDDPAVFPRGVATRLIHLDTPESRYDRPGWQKAKDELTAWLRAREGRLRCIFTEEPGAFDRILADIYTVDNRSDTASQWMLLHGNDGAGWPPYVKGQ